MLQRDTIKGIQRHVIKLNEQNEMDDIKTGDIIILLVITGGKARSRGN